MSPEEVRAVAEIARAGTGHLDWSTYVAILSVSILGAYLGSYIKRKAADRATNENFSAVRAQLQKTVQDTEEIKTTLSSRIWLSQQQWAIREQHYEKLLMHLTLLRNTLEDQSTFYLHPGSEHDDSIPDRPEFRKLSQAADESYQALRGLTGPASIFLSSAAVSALDRMMRAHWVVAENSSCTEEDVSDSLKLTEAAHAAVLAEARSELTQIIHLSAREPPHGGAGQTRRSA